MFSSLVQPGVKMLQHICRGWRLWIWNGPVDFLFCSFRFRHSVVAQRHAGATFLANCSSNILPPHCSTCIIARQLSSQESSCAAHLKLCYAQTQKLGETRRFFVFLTFFFLQYRRALEGPLCCRDNDRNCDGFRSRATFILDLIGNSRTSPRFFLLCVCHHLFLVNRSVRFLRQPVFLLFIFPLTDKSGCRLANTNPQIQREKSTFLMSHTSFFILQYSSMAY